MATAITAPLRVAVVGGGPAGSLFALYALHYGAQAGREVLVTLFEARDFNRAGSRGCNMCAGIIPADVLRDLRGLNLTIPPSLVMGEIDSYALHTASGCLRVTMMDPDARAVTVFRGNGPGPGLPPEPISFDSFLLAEAERRGARVIRQQIEEICARPRRWVRTHDRVYHCDLIVLASGVNGSVLPAHGLPYVPPRTEAMAQGEVFLGSPEVRNRLGSAVHVFFPRSLPVVFGTLVPKGPFVSISLLGRGTESLTIREFLGLQAVQRILPEGSRQVCACRPRIAVGPASYAFAEGFVAVGDAGVTRLYKNGVGTALVTARRAAETAVLRGIEEKDFREHYGPLCQKIHRDNRFGRFLFSVVAVLMRSQLFSTRYMLVADREGERPPDEQAMRRILWGLLTGSYPYEEIFRMLLHVGFERSLSAA
ncbi:MAG: hypothetical protein HY574_01290 [candidate division NC10 bacterium]|nr:hypothetical protein [candidate division NC10 bacterium]